MSLAVAALSWTPDEIRNDYAPEWVLGRLRPQPEAQASDGGLRIGAADKRLQTLTELSSRRRPFDVIGRQT